MKLHGDSWDYDLVYKGVQLSKDTEGACLEIGLRMGGGTKEIIDSIHRHCPNKIAVAIDPYGSVLYEHKQNHFVRLDYTEAMKADCLQLLYPYANHKNVHFVFINMSDLDFFDYYKDGIPVYSISRKLVDKYSFVNFDGPHSVEAILKEVQFFETRINEGACFCFDDVSTQDVYYDHQKIEDYLLNIGFKIVEKRDKKALYQYKP
jgi:hypothetical protein